MGIGDIPASLQAKQTEAFVNYRPTDVILIRTTKVADGQGGYTRDTPTPLPPQKLRLVKINRLAEIVRMNAAGRQVSPNWTLLGDIETDMKRFDTCTVEGHKLEIVHVTDIPNDSKIAECWEAV